MARLMFIEGISGAGKSTLARALAAELRTRAIDVTLYIEGDFANPIDFCAAACLTRAEYAALCVRHAAQAALIRAHTVDAGAALLVRYRGGAGPLFTGALLEELRVREFSYRPVQPVARDVYEEVYRHVWRRYAADVRGARGCVIFDGALIHHRANDLMLGYGARAGDVARHVAALWDALDGVERRVCYLSVADVAGRLRAARLSRGQSAPDAARLAFWQARAQVDRAALNALGGDVRCYGADAGGWRRSLRDLAGLALGE